MRLGLNSASVGLLLAVVALASCRSMGAAQYAPPLLRLAADARPPEAAARLTGTLVQAGDYLAVEGGGTTVVVWAHSASARSAPGSGNTIVVWPRSATIERRSDGGGSVVIIWPRTIGSGTPIRLGERVELVGDMKDDVSGLRFDRPAPRGFAGPVFVVREFRPAPAPAEAR